MIRGEYDPNKLERLRAPIRRAWSRVREAMSADDPAAPPPPPDVTTLGRVHRAGLVVLIIGLSAALMAALTIPAVALIGKLTRGVASKLDGGPQGLEGVSFKIAQRSVVFAAGGEVIATLAGEENRTYVPLDRVPEIAQQAVLAIEDAHFYEHHGVSMTGLFRAVFANVEAGGVRQGGSTITQQLVKNIIVGNERSIDRKIREAQYAVALEKEKTKREILELYLNETYFGSGVYGIGTAAEYYFGKSVEKLTLPEAALLAGVVRAPETYGPFVDKQRALGRRNLVLDRMAQERFITNADAEKAKQQPLVFGRHPLPKPVEPYFLEYVKEQILENPAFGPTRADRARALFQGGLKIYTTLDLKLQKAASEAVSKVLTSKTDPAAAMVSIEASTGKVKAMVGGSDFEKNKYNLAVQGLRQAGSAFKPFTMIAALESGISPGYTLDTPSPLEITDANGQVWHTENYSHHGEGIMNMRQATENSVNAFYAQLINKVGPQKVVDVAHKLGITSDLKPYLSLALGTFEVSPYEMSSAYSTLANNGVHCAPFAIVRIDDAAGKTVVQNDPDCHQVLDPKIAAQADGILQGVIERGTGHTNGQIGRPTCGKTGTTDDYKDAWFVGFTPQFSTVVWIGYPKDRTRPLYNIHGYPKVFGGSLPAIIWNRFMKAAHVGLPIVPFPAPPPVVNVQVPNVVGKTRDEAKAELDADGFTLWPRSTPSSLAPGTIASQSPAAGTPVEAGAMITLFISDGSIAGTPTPEPDASPTPQPT